MAPEEAAASSSRSWAERAAEAHPRPTDGVPFGEHVGVRWSSTNAPPCAGLGPLVRRLSNTVGFDDAPFAPEHRGDVRLIGAVCAQTRLDGVVSGVVRRDGRNSTSVMAELASRFGGHVQVVLLQGIAVAGFNVVDVLALHERLDRPVLVVARRQPNLRKMRVTLRERIPGGERKWRLIERLGPMEKVRDVFVQRIGISVRETETLLAATTRHGHIPEPLRMAHLIAGGITTGRSRGRA